MTLILGLLVGAAIGWIAYRFFRLNSGQGLGVSLLIGVVGGGIGVQLATAMGRAPGVEGELAVFPMVLAAAAASAGLIVASMLSRRRGADR